jgi:hypothetical protein
MASSSPANHHSFAHASPLLSRNGKDICYQSIKGEKGKETSRSPTDLQQEEADMPPLEMTNNLVGFDNIN